MPLLAACLLVSSNSTAADWYIADNGSDSSGCTDGASDACKTLQHVLDTHVSTGDTIYCMPGTYTAAGQGVTGTGHAVSLDDPARHSNVTITAQDPSNKPYFVGTDTDHFRIRVYPDVTGVVLSYLRIDFSSSGYQGSTFAILAQGRDTTIDHCDFRYGGSLIMQTDCRGFTVSNCSMDESWWQGGSATSDSHWITNWACDTLPSSWNEKIYIYNNDITKAYADGMQFAGNIPYIEIANNRMSFFGEQALDFKGVNNILIHDNDFSHASQREAQAPGTDANWNQYDLVFATKDTNRDAYNWFVYNNTFHDNVAGGIGANDDDGQVQDWYVWNNVFHDLCQEPRYGCAAINLQLQANSTAAHNSCYNVRQVTGVDRQVTGIRAGPNGDRIVNNALLNCGDDSSDDDGAISSDGLSGAPSHNYFYSTNRGDSGCAGGCVTAGATDVTSPDPGWVAEETGDFTLEESSVCIDGGMSLANAGSYTPEVDKAQNPRPNGSAFDIGAFEYWDPATQDCAAAGGACCQSGQACDAGAFQPSLDCGNWCCVGGTCQGQVDSCQAVGYRCCAACAAGPHPEYDGDCAGQTCCESCVEGAGGGAGAGAAPAAADEGGCGCALPGRRPRPGPWCALLLLLVGGATTRRVRGLLRRGEAR